MTRRMLFALTMFALLFGGAMQASATLKNVRDYEEVKPVPCAKGDKDPRCKVPIENQPSGIRARVKSDVPALKTADFKVRQSDVDPPTESPAKSSQPFKESNEEMAVAILVQGNERFMGMNPLEQDGTPRENVPPGAYPNVKAFIDGVTKIGPKKTRGTLIVYGKDVVAKVPMGEIAAITGDSLGAPKDYYDIGSKQFKNGLESAFQALANDTAASRKILVYVGDCGDVKLDIGIDDTINKLRAADIEVYAVRYTPVRDEDQAAVNRCKKLGAIGVYKPATKGDELNDIATQIATDIDSLYTVEFPGDTLPPDGKEHTYVVLAKKDESDERAITLRNWEVKVAEEKKSAPIWPWILGGVGVLGLVGVIALVMKSRSQSEMQPMMDAAPPPPGPAAPAAPAAPMKTMMLGVGGQEDGIPVVGWIVPINGPMQFQTFKLQPGKTSIGTAPDCNVVVADPFMSTHHCEIVMTPVGFSLLDKGSTNGVIVNSRRVPTHELVDNDVFTLGKTDFKFKSTS